MKRERNIGDMAEAHFSELCASVGLVANSSERDRTGWDFIVEQRPEVASDQPLLLHSEPLVFNAQVKGTTNPRGSVRVKLSTLLHLCRSSTPAFLVIVVYGSESEPPVTYFRHLDKREMERIWKRVYKEQARTKKKPLSKIYIRFSPCDRDFKIVGAQDVLQAYERNVQPDLSSYREKKASLIKNVGLDGFSVKVKFPMEELGKLEQSFLGHDHDVEVSEVQHIEKRFGIEFESEDIPTGPARLKIHPRGREVKVFFSDDNFENELKAVAELYSAPPLVRGDENGPTVRVVGETFEFLFTHDHKINVKYSLNIEARKRLSEIREAVKLSEMLFSPHGCSIRLEISGGGEFVFSTSPKEVPEHLTRIARLLRYTRELLLELKVYEKVSCSVKDILDARTDILAAHSRLFRREHFALDAELEREVLPIMAKDCIVALGFPIGETIIAAVSKHRIKTEISRKSLTLSLAGAEAVDAAAVKTELEMNEFLDEAVARVGRIVDEGSAPLILRSSS